MNQTTSTILGESYGSWILGVFLAGATLALAIAAFWSARRANNMAGEANTIAQESIAKQAVLAGETRRLAIIDEQFRELEETISRMALLSASNPLEPRPPFPNTDEYPSIYARMLAVYSAMQEYGALMGRAKLLERRLREAGLQIGRGGATIFPHFQISEREDYAEKLRSVLDALGSAIGTLRAVDSEIEGLYNEVVEFWSKRWFNLPHLPLQPIEPLDLGAR